MKGCGERDKRTATDGPGVNVFLGGSCYPFRLPPITPEVHNRTDTKITLPESNIPTRFYNIAADLPTPLPPLLHPGTRQPIGPEALAPIFPMELIGQEVSVERWIEIPDEVRDIYRLNT